MARTDTFQNTTFDSADVVLDTTGRDGRLPGTVVGFVGRLTGAKKWHAFRIDGKRVGAEWFNGYDTKTEATEALYARLPVARNA